MPRGGSPISTRGHVSQLSSLVRSDHSLIELVTLAEIEAYSAQWQALWQRCPRATVFQRPDWLIPWCRHVLRGEPRALIVMRAGEPIGIAPLFFWSDGGSRVVSLMGAGASDYCD